MCCLFLLLLFFPYFKSITSYSSNISIHLFIYQLSVNLCLCLFLFLSVFSNLSFFLLYLFLFLSSFSLSLSHPMTYFHHFYICSHFFHLSLTLPSHDALTPSRTLTPAHSSLCHCSFTSLYVATSLHIAKIPSPHKTAHHLPISAHSTRTFALHTYHCLASCTCMCASLAGSSQLRAAAGKNDKLLGTSGLWFGCSRVVVSDGAPVWLMFWAKR